MIIEYALEWLTLYCYHSFLLIILWHEKKTSMHILSFWILVSSIFLHYALKFEKNSLLLVLLYLLSWDEQKGVTHW